MKRLKELLDRKLVINKRIAIIEESFADCTFLIKELSCLLQINYLFSFYKKKEFYGHTNFQIDTVFEPFYSNNLSFDVNKRYCYRDQNNIKNNSNPSFYMDIKTILDNKIKNLNVIIDDFKTAKEIFNIIEVPTIAIFRSDSFNSNYIYDFDIIFEVKPLKSGISPLYDGVLKIFERDIIHINKKYRVDDEIGNIY